MTLFEIVGLYVAVNILLAPLLMYRVGQVRMSSKVSLGDGGDAKLLSRIRAHANFTDTAPFALIGLISLASLSANPIALHVFGRGSLDQLKNGRGVGGQSFGTSEHSTSRLGGRMDIANVNRLGTSTLLVRPVRALETEGHSK